MTLTITAHEWMTGEYCGLNFISGICQIDEAHLKPEQKNVIDHEGWAVTGKNGEKIEVVQRPVVDLKNNHGIQALLFSMKDQINEIIDGRLTELGLLTKKEKSNKKENIDNG